MGQMRAGRRGVAFLICVVVALFAGQSFSATDSMRVALSARARLQKEKPIHEECEEESPSGSVVTVVDVETSVCTLILDITSRSHRPAICQLEWYFLADQISPGKNNGSPVKSRDVVRSGKKEISIEPGSRVSERVMADFELTTTTRDYSGDQWSVSSAARKKGREYLGYIVLLTQDGQVIAKKSNSSRWLKDEWLEKCRNYKPRKPR